MRNLTIKQVAKDCYQNSLNKGFHQDPNPNIDRKLLLVMGEIAEAHEELRAGHDAQAIYYSDHADNPNPKPEGFVIELADAVIRIFDLTECLGLDIQAAIEMKMAFNATRPFRHGKQF